MQSDALEWKCFKVNHGCGTGLPKLIWNQQSDRPSALSDEGLLRDAVRGTGLDSVQSFPSKLVVVPFQIVRVVLFCFVALEKQVDSKLLGLVWSTRCCSMERANQTGRDFWCGCSVAGLTTGSCCNPGGRTSLILSFLGHIKEDSDKFSSSVPRMASVSVTLECKMYKVGHHCMKHQFIRFGAQSGLVLEVPEISFDLAPKSLGEFPQACFPISHPSGSPIWERGGKKNNLARLWGTIHRNLQNLFVFFACRLRGTRGFCWGVPKLSCCTGQ